MICFVSMEHESWLQDQESRAMHLAYCADVQRQVQALTGSPCMVLHYTEASQERLEGLGIKAILFSGNVSDWHHYDPRHLAALYGVIRRATWPFLGFCGGLQLIAMAHGATVAPMRRLRPGESDSSSLPSRGYFKEWGFMPVRTVAADPILDGLGPAPVFLEVHYCEVKEVPEGFQVLASSDECRIQLLKRSDRPVYGAQFHPEANTEAPNDRRSPLVNLVYPDGYQLVRQDGTRLLSNFFHLAGCLTGDE